MSSEIRCPGCGLLLQDRDGPTHDYMLSSPECYRMYGEILSREYSDMRYWKVHRLSVDTYAVQHPGDDDLRARQSVSAHLVSLYLTVVRGEAEKSAITALRKLTSRPKGSYPRLSPIPSSYEVTVADPFAATGPGEYQEIVRTWAQTTWEAWAPHHEYVKSLVDSLWG